jgi:hypothetical protein
MAKVSLDELCLRAARASQPQHGLGIVDGRDPESSIYQGTGEFTTAGAEIQHMSAARYLAQQKLIENFQAGLGSFGGEELLVRGSEQVVSHTVTLSRLLAPGFHFGYFHCHLLTCS